MPKLHFSNYLQLWHIVLQYIFINSIAHIFFEKIQYVFTIWWKSTPSIYLLLKIVSFFKTIISFLSIFPLGGLRKNVHSSMKIAFLQSLFFFLLNHFTLLLFYFFICFWCKLRRDIRVTIFFQNIIYCTVWRGCREIFLYNVCYLLNTDKFIFSYKINNLLINFWI